MWQPVFVWLLAMLSAPLAVAACTEMTIKPAGFPATFMEAGPEAPIVVMVAGSGPTDRDGNNPFGITASYLAKLADAFCNAGIASLRYDKRGVAGSVAPGPEEDILFGTFVADLDRVLDTFRLSHPGRKLVLLGHSEGGLVALAAAGRRSDLSALILIATPGRPPAATLREQLQALPEPMRGKALAILLELENGKRVDDVPRSLLALFRPAIQGFLFSLFAIEPAKDLASLSLPALVVGGGTDLQVRRADFDELATVRQVRSHWFEDMNHVLVDAPADRAQNFATYAQPDRPLARGLARELVGFLRGLDD